MGVPISNVTRRVVYAASGTGPYNFTFEILAAADIAVYRDDTLLTITTDYTVTINANGTGYVTLVASPTGATQIAIVGNRTIARTTDFVTGGDFFANTLNDELDQQTIFAQQNAEGLQRALQAPQTDPTSINMTLPSRTARANKTLSFDASGNPTPGVSAADVANAVTYATNAANSATAAAASASAASSSASSASGSASTATTQASNASSSASAASTSASNASTSATNAANSASTASTQASNASTSATNAASSASAASTSASNASTSATNAANSASTASTQATNAANSATAAAGSASAAAASAASAATALDSFDDRYLGTKASDPTLDNDGNALVAGALYFSTSQNIMKVYDGASWIAATSAGNTSLLRYRYVATSGQTTFSGSDSNAATLSYTVNNIVVFLNGVALDQTDYTATNGTSVVLTTGAALNDELVIVAFKSFVTADMVPASTGGTYAGAVRFVAGSASVPSISVDGDTNTGVFFPAADTVAIGTGGTERMRLDASGKLGIGTASPSGFLDVAKQDSYFGDSTNGGRLYFRRGVDGSAVGRVGWISGSNVNFEIANDSGSGNILFQTNSAERMRLDASGNLGIGTSSPLMGLDLRRSTGNLVYGGLDGNSNQFLIRGNLYYDIANARGQPIATGWQTQIALDNSTGSIQFSTSTSSVAAGSASTITERARITSGGNFVVAKTDIALGNVGCELRADGLGAFTRSGDSPLIVNRKTNDGTLVDFQQDNTSEGSISVSGNTVSYNPFLGSHAGAFADWSRPEIKIGTIFETINELIDYKVVAIEVENVPKRISYNGNGAIGTTATVEYEGQEYTGIIENERGQERDFNKHVKVKINDTPDSKAVYGVFVSWNTDSSNDGGVYNDMLIGAVGNYVIRMAAGQTPQIGDLVKADGTGCAIVQEDDIVRTKTVGKITNTIPQLTYEDGSFLVACVLYCG